ncbi:MAG: T9SS type A sorting domain-containing protein, partial [Bacteroidetes bacterium]|nr:T9SS type A sorting domain-containing protein [Bacteroidota bacterium]
GDFTYDSPSRPYSFFQNVIIWAENYTFSLEIFSLDGQKVLNRNLGGSQGSFVLPGLPYGIYILRISSRNETLSFKAYSDGQKTFPVDRDISWHPRNTEEGNDTLLIQKEGYFDRQLIVPRRDTLLEIALLKGDYEDLDYFNELIDPIAFDLISSLPSRSHQGGVRSVKVIYNEDDGLVYYQNTKKYVYHFTFAWKVLGFNQGNNIFNLTQYRESPDRYLYPGNINYYKNLDKYVLHLVAANEMSCEHIKRLYEKIVETSYLKGKLFFFPNKSAFELCDDIPVINSEELYKGINYQGLNLAENYGYLNKVKVEDLADTYLSRRDIIILDAIPNEVSVVAGIITTEFQTPLSHINVLSNSRGTPNMALRNAWNHPVLDTLLGELVYLKVKADTFEMRKATLAEATAFWSKKEPQNTTYLSKDLSVSGLVDLSQANHTFVDKIGGKAANFAEMLKVKANGVSIPVPEGYFAIPFYYYDQHIKDAGLDVFIDQMLKDQNFIENPAFRRQKLEELQDKIKDYPLDPVLIALVTSEIDDFRDFDAYRFRSSTNAEDLEIFSGAGLYDSYSAKKGDDKKTIENAIKKVWASLWNWRAFEERSYFKIDHQSCAMGILVHRSFPDEDANGVMITRNLYNENPGFIINVQYKEYSIVFPEPGILNDQIMLMSWSPQPGQNFVIEYLTFSNVPELNGKRVMTDEEILELAGYGMALKRYYYDNIPHSCNCSFEHFALDIEFKVDSEVSSRKVYVKQMRPYK